MFWRLLSLIAVDQITKGLIPRDFLIRNYALPFGIDLQRWNWTVLLLAGGAIAGYYVYFRSHLSHWSQTGFILIFSGAASNLVDRMVFGFVRDYLNLGIVTINLADLFIIAGLFVVLFNHDNTEKSFRH